VFFSHGDGVRRGGFGRPGCQDPAHPKKQEAAAVAGVGREGAGDGLVGSWPLAGVAAEARAEREEAARQGRLSAGAQEARARHLRGIQRRGARALAMLEGEAQGGGTAAGLSDV
jgi:hypothetical protein